ncbi:MULTISPECIES: MFS transporter [unclassified Mycolicibacterium]|uniref:MFS transporter n=1 Tax=unclassified Mycolicibacterium TaxID=2636767 RepID=UPI0012DC9088|nr:MULTISPECIES: MFS transporter [unclassified Mycolicibacterium]MUL84582.1 MFS transporter [Mycolicibacterium sp. CBMA 329]MUL88357.1 MFS transporter [Mycolicibacterium sp. CBMA 331]MUM25045.1 MFS transporter [Mycolicibacterium sp. CBMA 295]MUM40004.1 MFS transporter [Mycolicibacterium sp. CBMA 247]MUM44422.1 MFS transporter [Mycolicibacterium sp. CBMA 294]
MELTFGLRMLFATVCAVAVATIYAAQPVLAQVGDDLGVPEADLGWIVTAGQLGYLVGLVLLVPFGDMYDRRRLISGHLLLAAVGVALAATAARTWLLLTGLAVAGLFAVVVQTTVAYAAALSTPEERGRTLGVVTSGVVVGILGARVVAGTLAAVWGWRSVYIGLAVLLVALACVVVRLLPPEPRPRQATYLQVLTSFGQLFRERLFVSRGLIAFFLFASFGTLWSGLALPLAAAPWHLSTAQIGLFGIAGLAGALGAARAGRWADAGFASAITGGALVLLTASWLAIGHAPWSLLLIVVGVIVLDFAVQAVHVSNQHLLTAAHPNRTSSVIGGYMFFYSLGSALGATATTAVFSIAGWTGSTILGAAFATCALIVWAVSRRDVTNAMASHD